MPWIRTQPLSVSGGRWAAADEAVKVSESGPAGYQMLGRSASARRIGVPSAQPNAS